MANKRYLEMMMIDDWEKDLSVLGNPDYVDPIWLGFDFFETAVMRVWQNGPGYKPMEQYLLIEGMKMFSMTAEHKSDLEALQMILMYFHYKRNEP